MSAENTAERPTGNELLNAQNLLARVKRLEEINRFTLDALDMMIGQEDAHPSINKLDSPLPIVADTLRRVDLLIPFRAKAVCFVNEGDADFSLQLVDPESWRECMQHEMEAMIKNGVFAWALREKRPVMVPSLTEGMRFLLHVVATSSRIRGMFLGFLSPEVDEIPDVNWSLFSILLQRSANALESFALYRLLKEYEIRLNQ